MKESGWWESTAGGQPDTRQAGGGRRREEACRDILQEARTLWDYWPKGMAVEVGGQGGRGERQLEH